MPDVLLAVPPMQALSVPPQIGIGYLAAVLRAKGYRVEILHCDARGINRHDFEKYVLRSSPEVLGMTVVTMAYPVVVDICRTLQAKGYSGRIILGGNHVTALPELALCQTGAAAVLCQEGEHSIVELVDAMAAGHSFNSVPGVWWLDGGKPVSERSPLQIEDLDSIPFPAWDLMTPSSYPHAPHQLFSRRSPVAPIITSRGCPNRCTFCASKGMWGRRWRARSVDNVMEEIRLLVRYYGVREIHIVDDDLLFDEDRILTLCDRIASAGYDLVFSLPNGVRTDAINDRVAAAFARAGFYEIGLGIDAPFRHQQERVKKIRGTDAAVRAVEIVRRHGMECRGYWLLGFDVDTEEDIRRTIDYMLSVPADFAAIGVCAPIPGSDDFENLRNTIDDLDTFDWSQISYFHALNTPKVSQERLQALLREAVLRFYLRPGPVLKLLRRVKLRQWPFIARGLYRYLTGSLAKN